ncbi:MAG TPA: phospholipase D family protein [Caldimonas sp.]|nr:phospholipase D family protein [Caldimonas sp.]
MKSHLDAIAIARVVLTDGLAILSAAVATWFAAVSAARCTRIRARRKEGMSSFCSRLLGPVGNPSMIAWLGLSGLLSLAGACWARAVLLMIAVALGGCAVLPSQIERPASYARLDVSDTTLARIAAASTPADARELSGFRLLPDGAQAFEARLALIRRAERTIDVQYYLIASDRTGLEFLRELELAAARGVRVRILVDDLYATGEDELFSEVARHERIEVRMFNPLPARTGGIVERIALSLHEFSRINRRMHNKLLIADGTYAVTGGRNIADAYFDRSGDANFIDVDLLAAGPVVARLAAVFDRYWNSRLAYPLGSLIGARRAVPARQSPAAAALAAVATTAPSTLDAELASGRLVLMRASADVIADAPEKADGDNAAPTVAQAHLALLGSAASRVLLASPYFVPGSAAMQTLAGMRTRDVEISVLTNSFATTDEPLVHLGYARHRDALLGAGVDLHELMASSEPTGEATTSLGGSGHGRSLGRLHTKLTVIDDEQTFLGSMNMDARSADLNTEAAIVVHSAALARLAAAFVRTWQRDRSYELRLRDEKLTWLSGKGASQRSRSVEPRPVATPALPVRVLATLLGESVL